MENNNSRPGLLISLIAAMALNRVIGNRGYMPWKIPAELRRFRSITMGHTVVMGRRTYESIGHALPGRINIVLTRKVDYRAHGCVIARDLPSAIKVCPEDENEVFVCGGGQLYKAALPLADRIYLSVIHREVEGDVFFPEVPLTEFHRVSSEDHEGVLPFTLSIYERIK